jgi:hypothetical protein
MRKFEDKEHTLAWFDISGDDLPIDGYSPCYLRVFLEKFNDSLGRIVLYEKALRDDEKSYDQHPYVYSLDYKLNLKEAGAYYFNDAYEKCSNVLRQFGLIKRLINVSTGISIASKTNLDDFLETVNARGLSEATIASFRVNKKQAYKLTNLKDKELKNETLKVIKSRLNYESVKIIDKFPLITPNNPKGVFYCKKFLALPINWPKKKEVTQSKLF